MQKLLTIITFFIGIFFLINNVSASSYTARAYINSSGNVRSGPGTQYGIVEGREKEGTYYLLVEDKLHADTNNHKDCIGDWYQVYYNGTSTGYICEDHVDVVYSHTTDDIVPSTTCEQKMSDAGFPELKHL